ncbi:MAG: NADP-dependent oxidoreductase domain [Tardiphaga sp.]|jgi:aryl-alcohol dehydrogenase-like predicted oxidoreductase|nr:NADP-dependent oxidoreductase domain [Tardiphaga sp.]
MEFYQVSGTDVRLSRVALGGHEYLPNGNSRGFNEDFAKAITPGHSFPGFGGERRKAVLRAAYDIGVNFFDVTLDAEKEALGRNLKEMPPPYPVYVQTRPEAMAYSYDPGNRKMTDLNLLRAEVQRILKVLQRERLELLNLGILRTAIDSDADFVAKLAANVKALQQEGLILFAAADTFSGEATYQAMMKSGAFASLNINFNVADDTPERAIFPFAAECGMRVVVREAYLKGVLFRLGHEAGIEDDALLARAAMKWLASRPGLHSVIIGADTAEHFRDNVRAFENPSLDATETAALDTLRAHPSFVAMKKQKHDEFSGGTAIGQRAAGAILG